MTKTKTKKVDGVSLSPSCFAYVGDEQDTSTWKLPIRFPGDEAKTRNHVKNALQRFDEMKHLPPNERVNVWLTLLGAAKAHGIRVEHRPERVQAEVQALELNESEAVLTDAELAVLIAEADRKSDALLKSLGYD